MTSVAVEPIATSADWLVHFYEQCEGWITLFSLDRRDGTRHTDWATVTDLSRLADIASRRAEHSCVWFGVATRRTQLTDGRRGGAEDCLQIPGLWCDIDVQGPNHRGAHTLPATIEAAADLINDFPLAPTAMVRSGGGLQGWWLFPEPISADQAAIDLLAAWGATWVELGRRRGFHVDNVFDVARIMRLPGTWNRKNQPAPVTAKAIWDRRWQPSDFETHLLEAPVAPEPGRIPYIGPERPGDAFNAVRRGGEILHHAGFTLARTDRSSGEEHWTRPGKDPKDGTSATVYADGHTTIWSDTVSTLWPSVQTMRPYDPFGLYAVLLCGGDFALASEEIAARGYGASARARDDLAWIDPGAASNVSEPDEEQEPPEPLPWPEMPPEAYHGLAGEVVAALTPNTEADPAGLLACFLTYFGTAAGPGPHFRLSGGSHNARIFVLVLGDSARARKGSAESMTRWVMRSADPTVASERRVGGLNSGEGLIEAVRDPKYATDKDGDLVVVDQGVTDKRLLLYEPEFAGRLMPSARRAGATTSALLRMAWDDGNLQTLTRNPLVATGAHICVIGNATMDELLLEMSPQDIAGGLMNRFLFVAVHSTNSLPFGGNISDTEVESLGRKVGRRLEVARTRSRLEFGQSSLETWPAAYQALRDDVPEGPLGHLTARGPVQVQRLALIYALLDGAATIDREHLAAGCAFWSYCRHSAELVIASQAGGQLTGTTDGDRMLQLLVDSGRAWSTRELKKTLGWNGSRVVAVRARLERLSMVKVGQVRGTGGRPRVVVEAAR